MGIDGVLQTTRRLFLDTAPVIYYVENHAQYVEMMDYVFERLDAGTLQAVTSPVTLAECLVVPMRGDDSGLQHDFIHVVAHGLNTTLVPADEPIGILAADLRARYGLSLPDAFQLATAITVHCDAFLTNDSALKRVSEIKIVVLDELTAA